MSGEDEHSAKPHGAGSPEATAKGPLRPPRPAIHLPLLPSGVYQLPDQNPCDGCDHCCRYVTIPIDTPRSRGDFDNIRWYVLHRNVYVIRDWEGQWMVLFETPCDWLKDGRCGHYVHRPDICREYDPAECERYCPEPAEKIMLKNEKDLDEFLAERARRSARRKAAAKNGKSTRRKGSSAKSQR